MAGGRPREHDRDQIAKDLIEWAQLEDSINLCGFCAKQFISPSKITKWAKECELFCQAYEFAKSCIGERRERMLSEDRLHVKAYDLNAKTYDHFLKEESKEEKQFESQLKTQEQSAVTEDQIKRHEDLMKTIKSLQSDRKIDDNNKSTDNKSA